jgi:hypothetical protein
MGKKVIIIAFVLVAVGLGDLYAASVTLGPNLKIPPHYKAGVTGADRVRVMLSRQLCPNIHQPFHR